MELYEGLKNKNNYINIKEMHINLISDLENMHDLQDPRLICIKE